MEGAQGGHEGGGEEALRHKHEAPQDQQVDLAPQKQGEAAQTGGVEEAEDGQEGDRGGGGAPKSGREEVQDRAEDGAEERADQAVSQGEGGEKEGAAEAGGGGEADQGAGAQAQEGGKQDGAVPVPREGHGEDTVEGQAKGRRAGDYDIIFFNESSVNLKKCIKRPKERSRRGFSWSGFRDQCRRGESWTLRSGARWQAPVGSAPAGAARARGGRRVAWGAGRGPASRTSRGGGHWTTVTCITCTTFQSYQHQSGGLWYNNIYLW